MRLLDYKPGKGQGKVKERPEKGQRNLILALAMNLDTSNSVSDFLV